MIHETDYTVIRHSSLADLCGSVKSLMAIGWEVHGQLIIDGHGHAYLQAMVKREVKQDSVS